MNPVALRRAAAPPPRLTSESDDFQTAVHEGLTGWPKAIPSKFFYDRHGSELFERICELPEYYPTRTEIGILEHNADEIAATIGPDVELVEFGAGALRKVRLLLDALPDLHSFLPIDISGPHLKANAASLSAEYPGLAIRPLVADYTAELHLPALPHQTRCRVGFFPGSTIGNFTPDDARRFLRRAARLLASDKGRSHARDNDRGGLLIGVDLVKDPARLHAAYNDAEGVTAAFNKNLLYRINNELDGHFDPAGFAHYAFYQPLLQRMEMHLVSLREQNVRVGSMRYDFAEGESIHTENSYKYTVAGFQRLAQQGGFRPVAVWTDPEQLFSLHWLAIA